MRDSQQQCARARRSRGFTLIELLVVIAVVGILAALLLPVLASAKDRAIRARCLGNLKQVDLAFIQYALENNDRLPNLPTTTNNSTSTANELGGDVFDVLSPHGLTRDILYDPGFPSLNLDVFWSFSSAHSTGYAFTIPQAGLFLNNNFGFLTPDNLNLTINPGFFTDAMGNAVKVDVSRRVLVADFVICMPRANTGTTNYDPTQPVLNYNFSTMPGVPPFIPYWRSPHLNKTIPSGGNEAMLDGSGRWFKFRSAEYNMIQRNNPGPPDKGAYIW